MTKTLYATVALSALMVAHVSSDEPLETVNVTGQDGKPLRVNKADFERDQSSDKPQYKLHKDQDSGTDAPATATALNAPEGTIVPPAPSAPIFNDPKGDNGGNGGDPNANVSATGAVAPAAPSANSYLVQKEGKKGHERYFVVNLQGEKQGTERGFNPEGYDTEALAIQAIKHAPPATSPTAGDPNPTVTPAA